MVHLLILFDHSFFILLTQGNSCNTSFLSHPWLPSPSFTLPFHHTSRASFISVLQLLSLLSCSSPKRITPSVTVNFPLSHPFFISVNLVSWASPSQSSFHAHLFKTIFQPLAKELAAAKSRFVYLPSQVQQVWKLTVLQVWKADPSFSSLLTYLTHS